jgi:hypothetical protein
LFPLWAYFIATFCGTLIARLVGTTRPLLLATLIGLPVLAGTFANLISIPHPLWFSGCAVLGIIFSALLASAIAATGNSSRNPSGQA